MKILLFSATPWNTDNSFGNTYSNLFEGMSGVEFFNIYSSFGFPKNNVSGKYFQIDEKSLALSIVKPSKINGREVMMDADASTLSTNESHRYEEIKKKRWWIFFLLRELIWLFGKWRSDGLDKFVDEAKCDILFVPLYHSIYLNRIILYLKRKTGLRMVTYVSDDVYTNRRISFSPYFWLNHFAAKHMVRKVVNQCEYIYVISDIQKKEYECVFNKECRILVKGNHFDTCPPCKNEISHPIHMVFTGNISAGRWKSLAIMAKAIAEVNHAEERIRLYIYSATPMTKRMSSALSGNPSVFLMGSVPGHRILQIQQDADVLVHVESFNLKERLQVRHSISTKIVDYFFRARCIFAAGPADVASIDYLIRNDAAVVALNQKMVIEKLGLIVNDPDILAEYAIKAWDCGRRNHRIDIIQKNLYNDLKQLIKEV